MTLPRGRGGDQHRVPIYSYEQPQPSPSSVTMSLPPPPQRQPSPRATLSTPVNAAGVVMRRRTSESEPSSGLDADDHDEGGRAANGAAKVVGKAFYEYQAKERDELSFDRGSVVEILSKDCDEDGWVYGKVDGHEGLIPENYVRLIGDQPKEIAGSSISKSDERVGDGGSSYVFKGRFGRRDVALKVPKGEKSLREQIDALKREALIYARLDNKNIVRFFGICYDPPCLVLELCEGATLHKLYLKLRYSVPSTVVGWGLQIARGMNHLHNRDHALIHADLKADNVLIKEVPCLCDHLHDTINTRMQRGASHYVSESNRCPTCHNTPLDRLTLKLTDFGISRPEKTEAGVNEGSIPWMSREIIVNNTYSKKSDVWSFGITIWELVTNHLPWAHEDMHALLIVAAIVDDRTPEIPDDCTEDLKQLMLACWRPTPADRPTFSSIISMLLRAQTTPASIKQQNVKQLNSRESLKKIRSRHAHLDEIRQLERLIKEKSIDRSIYAKIQYARPPPPELVARAADKAISKHRLSKSAIGAPTGFRQIMGVKVDPDVESSLRSPRRFVVNCFDEEEDRLLPAPSPSPAHRQHDKKLHDSINADEHHTLPRNYKTTTYQHQTPPLHIDVSNGNDPNDDTITTPTPSSVEYANFTIADEHEHLKPMRFGRPPKSYASNPELAGPLSARSPLSRTNAQRRRDVVLVHASRTEPTALDECMMRGPRGLNGGRLRSGSTTPALDTPKKKSSVFYVPDMYGSQQSLHSQHSHKPRSIISSLIKKLAPRRDSATLDDPLLACDRPPLPVCYHPNHSPLPHTRRPHLCGLVDTDELPAEVTMERTLEVDEPPEPSEPPPPPRDRPTTTRPFRKANEDKSRRRRAQAAQPLVTNSASPLAGGRGVQSQVAWQCRTRQSSECEPTSELSTSAASTPVSSENERRTPRSPSHHSSQDYRFADAWSTAVAGPPTVAAGIMHQRSRSSNEASQPSASSSTSSNSSRASGLTNGDMRQPIENQSYIPMQESLIGLHGHTLPTKRDTGRLSSPVTRPDRMPDQPRASAPVPPPRNSRSPAHVALRPAQPGSDTSLSASSHVGHKKRSALDLPVMSEPRSRTSSGASRRTTLHTPISSPELTSWPNSSYVEPLQNPNYKRQSGHMSSPQTNSNGRGTPPPVGRAPPPPPPPFARTPTGGAPPLVPKHLPLNPQQLKRASPRVTTD